MKLTPGSKRLNSLFLHCHCLILNRLILEIKCSFRTPSSRNFHFCYCLRTFPKSSSHFSVCPKLQVCYTKCRMSGAWEGTRTQYLHQWKLETPKYGQLRASVEPSVFWKIGMYFHASNLGLILTSISSSSSEYMPTY